MPRLLDWSSALRDLKADRRARPEVREDRIRVSGRLGMGMSAWRGCSSRRYVATVHAIQNVELYDLFDAVVLGVRRDDGGIARIVVATHGIPDERVARALLDTLQRHGVTEIHVHRLADTFAQRNAMVSDLISQSEDA